MQKISAITISLFLLLAGTPCHAQSMKDLFKEMPDSLCPLLTHNDRLDFIDYLASSMKAEVKNRLGGKSEMTAITDNYVHIHMTQSSEQEYKLLPYKDGNVICEVRRICINDSVSNSTLHFYSTKWERLPIQDFITLPAPDDYTFTNFVLSPADNTLTIILQQPLALPADNESKPLPVSSTRQWNEGYK